MRLKNEVALAGDDQHLNIQLKEDRRILKSFRGSNTFSEDTHDRLKERLIEELYSETAPRSV